MPRVTRDTALRTGRQVRVVLTGAELECDRDVLDAVREPLLHLVRNAVADRAPAVGAEPTTAATLTATDGAHPTYRPQPTRPPRRTALSPASGTTSSAPASACASG